MTAIPIAVAQFAPTADAAANVGLITQLVRAAASRSARLVVFPEYSSYFVDPFDESLEHTDLVGNFRATDDRNEAVARAVHKPLKRIDLCKHQSARI